MKPRVKDQLKDFGFAGTVEEFRAALIAVKRENYAEWPDEELAYTRHQAEEYCTLVRKRLGCQKLPRVFILRNLVNCRKNGMLGKAAGLAVIPAVAAAPTPEAQAVE